MIKLKKKGNVLISVYNKLDIVKFCYELQKRNYSIYTTTGTYNSLKKSGISTTEITDYTKFPEIMNGRVKTLHPMIHGGILSRRKEDKNVVKKYNMILFDIVVVNFFYLNNLTYCNSLVTDIVVNTIDIGGPAMIRSAAKNYKYVSVIVDPKDYFKILKKLDREDRQLSLKTNIELAEKAFKYTSNYELNISNFFKKIVSKNEKKNSILKKNICFELNKVHNLRYGENPDQRAALYTFPLSSCSLSNKNMIIGSKKLSYNNVYDGDIALECVTKFKKPACVIIKHGNPCGVATGLSAEDAYLSAYKCDQVSAYGSVIAFNCLLNEAVVKKIIENTFTEVIIAPEISISAKKILVLKNSIRVIVYNKLKIKNNLFEVRSVNGGVLLQEKKNLNLNKKWKIVTKKIPSEKEMVDAKFAWLVCNFVKSNGIVCVHKSVTIGIGSGQSSRIDSLHLAINKIKNKNVKFKNIVLASDAFFPFKDCVDVASKNNITCIVQPGGSIRDNEVIELANKKNISIIFTKDRSFRH